MLKISKIWCRTLDLDAIEVYFETAPHNEDELDYTFEVLRSEAQYSDFLPISKPFSGRFHFSDTTPKQRHFFRSLYYKIEVTRKSDSKTVTYPEEGLPGASVEAEPDLEAIEISRILQIRLSQFTGRLCWIFTKRTFGQRCLCHDPVTGSKTRSSCALCWNTGWVGGYHSPLQVYADIISPSEQSNPSDMAKFTTVNARGILSGNPRVREGAILIEPENLRWRIGPINTSEKNRSVFRQEFSLHRIPTDDIIYKLPINIDNLRDFQPLEIRQMTNPQSLGGDE